MPNGVKSTSHLRILRLYSSLLHRVPVAWILRCIAYHTSHLAFQTSPSPSSRPLAAVARLWNPFTCITSISSPLKPARRTSAICPTAHRRTPHPAVCVCPVGSGLSTCTQDDLRGRRRSSVAMGSPCDVERPPSRKGCQQLVLPSVCTWSSTQFRYRDCCSLAAYAASYTARHTCAVHGVAACGTP